ncbi:SDR family oxidoreductase [Piscinibacter sakaiensis]|uniref:3-oxoacyl-ACP reductase n=1 Tax=Piscinibacter sakaiensis TaxID=1547922 RepID=A0A0K8P3B4_PISS1|nr:SDR family oxidoreductase [Piscinibacter sakaiensis]GAP36650.1 3-oxoacyl-ACP reductase [Piscinibacter sakaiensis]
MRLDDKGVVITGGAGGIGLATVERCLEEGARVVLADRPGGDGPGLAVSLAQRYGGRCSFVAVDVTSTPEVDALFEASVERLGRIDGVFSNAGIASSRRPAVDCPDDEYERVMDVNLGGVFRVGRAALKLMMAQRSGSIVNCASGLAVLPRPNSASYSAAKAGVVSLTGTFALEAAAHEVRVNAVSPGYIDTPLIANVDAQRRRQMVEIHPLGRLGLPREVAAAVVFLLSDDASFITGTNLSVDGGYAAGTR